MSSKPRRWLATAAMGIALLGVLAGCKNPFEKLPEVATSPSATAPSVTQPSPSSSPSPTVASTPLGKLSGTWQGTWTNTSPVPAVGTFVLALVQQDGSLFGSLQVNLSNCIKGGNVTGAVIGTHITFGAVDGTTLVEYDGTLKDDNTLEGTYHTACGNSTGTWRATRAG